MPVAPLPERRTVHFTPLPSDILVATFSNSTGLQGKRRCKANRQRLPTKRPFSAAKTLHPNKQRDPVPPPVITTRPTTPSTRPPCHSHVTCIASHLRHISAAARHVILTAARAAHTPSPSHFAFHGNAFNPDTSKLAENRELSQCSEGPLWQCSNAEEIGPLAQGHGAQKGTNTMYCIKVSDIPKGRKATYLRVVAALRPEKENPRRVRWTVGGNRIEYPADEVSTKTANLTTAKLLFNSTISTPNAHYMADHRP